MVSAASAVENTVHGKSPDASLSSRLAAERELAEVTQRVEEVSAGPRCLNPTVGSKRKASTVPLDTPRFRRGVGSSFRSTLSAASCEALRLHPVNGVSLHAYQGTGFDRKWLEDF
jgi:hypothetical protein